MAKKWTVAEAFAALRSGDSEARYDIGKRFPLFATATPEEIISMIDDKTARQIDKKLRNAAGLNGSTGSDDGGDEDEEKKEKSKSKSKGKGKGKGKGNKSKKDEEPEEEPEVDDEDIDDDLDDLFDDEDED